MRARKRFGQHFLSDQQVLQQITHAVALRQGQCVLEIGPGTGALTEHLIAAAKTDYTAIEIDRDLVPQLHKQFPALRIINADVLDVDLETLLIPTDGDGWRVVGNLPYNISSPLILKFILHSHMAPGCIRDMHFMLQKEMADRLGAQPGSKAWGRLSVMVQVFAEVDGLFDVPPSSFSPRRQKWIRRLCGSCHVNRWLCRCRWKLWTMFLGLRFRRAVSACRTL